jgi:hypothetical protein
MSSKTNSPFIPLRYEKIAIIAIRVGIIQDLRRGGEACKPFPFFTLTLSASIFIVDSHFPPAAVSFHIEICRNI